MLFKNQGGRSMNQAQNRDEYLSDLEKRWNETLVRLTKTATADNQSIAPENAPYVLQNTTKKTLEGKHYNWVLLTSPSGAGKTTFGKALETAGFKRLPRVRTRKQRPGESSKDYHFVTREEFDQLLEAGAFLWYIIDSDVQAENRGILKEDFERMIESGEKFYIDAGIETAHQFPQVPEVKKTNFLFIFLLPPSFKTLRERLESRVQEEQDKIAKGLAQKKESSMTLETVDLRLRLAVEQLEQSEGNANYYVVNDDLKTVPQKAKEVASLLD